MQIEVVVKCMQTNFGGRSLSRFRDLAPFCLPSKMAKISFSTMDYSPWGSKNRIGSKSMQVEVVVKCMQTNFGARSLSRFGDLAPFCWPQKRPKFPFRPWTIAHGGQKIESAQNSCK